MFKACHNNYMKPFIISQQVNFISLLCHYVHYVQMNNGYIMKSKGEDNRYIEINNQ